MSKWSDMLVKKQISEHLVDKVRDDYGPDYICIVPPILEATIESEADVKALKDAIKEVKPRLSEGLFKALQEEYREIADDSKWKSTRRGNYIMRTNEWAEPFHAEFRARKQYDDVIMGYRSSRRAVMLSGKVKSKRILKQLLKYIESKDPPFKLLLDVTVGPKYQPSGP